MFNQTQPWAMLAHDPAQDPASVASAIRTGLDAIEAALPAGFAGAAASVAARWPVYSVAEASALVPARGIVGNLLYEAAVGILYAETSRWKTFVIAAWAEHIGEGRAWLGRPVTQGDVLIWASESARDMGHRCEAVRRHYGMTGPDRVKIVEGEVLLNSPAEVDAMVAYVRSLGQREDFHPAAIIIDTLAASMDGDENAAEVAGRIIRAARRVSRASNNALVLLVAHTGYDQTHMRGSTAFRANADLVIKLEGGVPNKRMEPGQPLRVVCDKPHKASAPFDDFCITVARKTWSTAEDGATISSLVIVATDAQPQNRAADKTPPNRAHLLKTIIAAQGLYASDLEHLFVETAPRTMTRSTLYEHLKALKFAGQIEQRPDGAYSGATPASPGSPVRSGLRPTRLGNEVRSGCV
jgi:hypothetical protein